MKDNGYKNQQNKPGCFSGSQVTSRTKNTEKTVMNKTQQRTNEQSQLRCFSGSQAGLLTQNTKKTDMDNEAKSIIYIQSHDKSKSRLDVNLDSHTVSSIKHEKSLVWRFRQLCKFWQPILGAIAAIVSLLAALFRML